jgi:hypothetical protein
MAFTFGDVRKSLRKKGFAEERDRDHVYLRFYFNGRKTHVYTKCSHGADGDDIRHPVANAMKRQLDLDSRKELEGLINCPMTQEAYIELLQGKNSLPK